MTAKRPGAPLAHEPAEYKPADYSAVQAVAAGTASPEQQRRAMQWIVEACCLTYDLGWDPSSPHAASFAAGRRFAGLQIVKAIKVNVGLLTKGSEHG